MIHASTVLYVVIVLRALKKIRETIGLLMTVPHKGLLPLMMSRRPWRFFINTVADLLRIAATAKGDRLVTWSMLSPGRLHPV